MFKMEGFKDTNPINPENSSMLKKLESEDFHEITKDQQLQYLVSNLIRGVINGSQIVKEGDRYFSHKQKLENTTPKENLKLDTISDLVILEYVFSDYDHYYYDYKNHKEEHKNLIINEEADNSVTFDYGLALSPKSYENIYSNDKDIESLKNRIKNTISNYIDVKNRKSETNDLIDKIKEKNNKYLLGNFKDITFFKAVLEKTKVDLTCEDFRYFFETMEKFGVLDEGDMKNQEILAEVLFNDIRKRIEILNQAADEYKVSD